MRGMRRGRSWMRGVMMICCDDLLWYDEGGIRCGYFYGWLANELTWLGLGWVDQILQRITAVIQACTLIVPPSYPASPASCIFAEASDARLDPRYLHRRKTILWHTARLLRSISMGCSSCKKLNRASPSTYKWDPARHVVSSLISLVEFYMAVDSLCSTNTSLISRRL